MTKTIYRIDFGPEVDLEESKKLLAGAIMVIESLYGTPTTLMDLATKFDDDRRVLLIDGTEKPGVDLAKIFIGFAVRNFGEMAFKVERLDAPVETVPVSNREQQSTEVVPTLQ